MRYSGGRNKKRAGRKPSTPTSVKYRTKKGKVMERPFYTKEGIFLSRLASIMRIPQGKVREAFSYRAETIIRLNPLAGDTSRIKSTLERRGLELEAVPWSKDTYKVLNQDKSDLGKLPEYEKGLFYIQSLASMLPVIVLDPQPGEKILDMCAAPGSKTTQIAALTGNKAEITAGEDDYTRAKKLESVLEQFHVKNVDLKITDGRKHGRLTPFTYDKVLLDAPCSGEGLIYLRSASALRFWSIRKSKILALLQRDLIESAFRALKTGGTLVYSTCTLEPAENEGIVSFLLDRHKDARLEEIHVTRSEEFKDYKSHIRSGITFWSDNHYNNEVDKTIRVLPGPKMQAFYVAKIKKI